MKKFVAISNVTVVPGLTLVKDTVLSCSKDGRYYVPGTLIEVTINFLTDDTLFKPVSQFMINDMDIFLKGVMANIEKELNVGDDMITFDIDTLQFVGEVYVGDMIQLATLASGFSIPLPANDKQKYNRVNKLNSIFNLDIDMNAMKVQFDIETLAEQKLRDLTNAINEVL